MSFSGSADLPVKFLTRPIPDQFFFPKTLRLSAFVGLLLVFVGLQGCASGNAERSAMVERRTPAAIAGDKTIETLAAKRIETDYPAGVHIEVSSFNRFVLITGQVPSETVKTQVVRIVGEMPAVRGFVNELTVGAVASMKVRRNDAYLSNDVKIQLRKSPRLNTVKMRVVSEQGIVYLMGLSTRAEADAAAKVASATPNAAKIVRVFEYLD